MHTHLSDALFSPSWTPCDRLEQNTVMLHHFSPIQFCPNFLRFIHSVVYLMTSPQPLPKWVLHRVWPSASSFKFQYPLPSLRSSSSCLCLLPHLPISSTLPSIFPSITHFRRHLLHPSPASHFKIFQVFLISFLKCPRFSTIQSYAPNVALY